VLFTVMNEDADAETAAIEVVDVETGKRKVVHRGGYYARYVPTGHILYVSDGTLFALPFDVDRLEPAGASQMPVLEGLAANPGQGAAQYDVSDSGLLTYVEGSAGQAPYAISWVDRDGRTETLVQEESIYGNPRLSPEGRRLAFTMLREGNIDVWVYDLERGVPTRITFADGYDADQIWSPDGRYLIFTSDRDGGMKIYRKRADGSGTVEPLADCGMPCWPSSLTPDGSVLAVMAQGEGGDILFLRPGEESSPEVFLATPFNEGAPAFSPDGRWIAYASLESGSPEIYVQSFPPGDGKWQVSAGTGVEPRWSRNGRELFFRTNEGLMVAAVETTGGSFRADRARTLFNGSFLGGLGGVSMPGYSFPDYDVGADGRRFVMFPGNQQQGFDVTSVHMVSGWFSELRRLASAGSD
jgi:serine/threonine-protein kinase